MNIEVIRHNHDQTERDTWSFHFENTSTGAVVLKFGGYVQQQRETKRHKWRVVKYTRGALYGESGLALRLDKASYKIPDDVVTDARKEAAQRVSHAIMVRE